MEGLKIDTVAARAWRHGAELSLSRSEFAVLCALAEAGGRVLSRAELSRRAGLVDQSDRRPDALISKLRRVLGHDALRTVRGRGWALAP